MLLPLMFRVTGTGLASPAKADAVLPGVMVIWQLAPGASVVQVEMAVVPVGSAGLPAPKT